MRRLLTALALLSVAGCSCFDEKYREYCDATQRCGVAASPVSVVRFDPPLQDPLDALSCTPFTLELRLADGGVPAVFPPTEVGFTMTPADAFNLFQGDSCNGGTVTAVTAVQPKVQLSLVPRRFGRVELRADPIALEPDGDTASLEARAFFEWSPAGYFVPAGDCTNVSAKLQAIGANGDTRPVPAATDTFLTVTLSGGFTGRDVDGGCSTAPAVRFRAGEATATVLLGVPTASMTGRLEFATQPGSVTQVAAARLDSSCSPPSAVCGGVACCAGSSCGAGRGVCAVPTGSVCLNSTDCETVTCGGTGTCQ